MVTAELKYTVPSIFVPSGFLPKFSATLELNREMPAYSSRERLAVLITVTLVTTIYAMTITIANVALPRIQGALSATTDEIALVSLYLHHDHSRSQPTTSLPSQCQPKARQIMKQQQNGIAKQRNKGTRVHS